MEPPPQGPSFFSIDCVSEVADWLKVLVVQAWRPEFISSLQPVVERENGLLQTAIDLHTNRHTHTNNTK